MKDDDRELMMEVKDLWKMNVAKNLKLLAGSKGAHYKIRWMYVRKMILHHGCRAEKS